MADSTSPHRADVVVIGSGAGGAPAAAVLAESGFEVLLLEAGPRLEGADFGEDEAETTRRLGRMVATADGNQSWYAGVCVGGSTVLNDALCWRTPPEILASWRREHGLLELDDAAFAPWIDRAWRDLHAEPTGRTYLNRNAWKLEVGARRLGWAAEAMPRSVKGCARLGRCNFGCPIDAKQSMLVSYVPRAERAGARVVPNLRVRRILVQAGAVTGVEATRLDPESRSEAETLRIDAPIVCLAAGVLGSGALLQQSGLGGEAAGRGLQAHSSVHVTARFDEPIHGYFGPTMAYAVSEWSDVNGHDGPGYMLENVAVYPLVTASALPGFGDPHAEVIDALPRLARCVVLVRDRTRGAVSVAGAGRARFDYALEAEDVERARHGMGSAARAYLAAGAREVYLPLEGFGVVRGASDLERLPDWPLDPSRLSFLYAVHLFGGAAMGGASGASVCAPDGACRGVRGLYVTDAAALPSNTGVNPQITIVANALRVAHGIAAQGPPS